MTKTVGSVLGDLTQDERAIICFALNAVGERYKGIHKGSLPFVSLTDALVYVSLWLVKSECKFKRKTKRLAEKLRSLGAVGMSENIWQSTLYLDDALVYKRFGRHPEHGKQLSHTVRAEAGMKFNHLTNEWMPNPIDVKATVSLKFIKKNLWVATCDRKHEGEVIRYLLDYCR